MLNVVKHLYRFVGLEEDVSQRMQDGTAEILHYARHNRHFSLIPVFQYSMLLIYLLLASISKAQVYAIKTLDGTNTTIRIRHKAFTPFYISCPTDKLILRGYWGTREIKVVHNKFLEIIYYECGGTGVGTGNTLLLCISHGKLRQVMHISSYNYSLGYKRGYTQLLLDAENNAHATIHDTVEFRQNARPDSTVIKKSNIKFSATQRIFCNYQKKVNTLLGSYNYKTNQVNRWHFNGVAPAFRLDGCEYIFINGRWYGTSENAKSYFLID